MVQQRQFLKTLSKTVKKSKTAGLGPTDAQVNRSLISPKPADKEPPPLITLSPLHKEHISRSEVMSKSEGGRTVNLKNISIMSAAPLAENA